MFVALVVVHLVQRRRTAKTLLRHLARLPGSRTVRMARADAWLACLTAAMFIAGIIDWTLGHPTRIRWHAITGVLLAITVVLHTSRHWRRLGRSPVR